MTYNSIYYDGYNIKDFSETPEKENPIKPIIIIITSTYGMWYFVWFLIYAGTYPGDIDAFWSAMGAATLFASLTLLILLLPCIPYIIKEVYKRCNR